MKEVELIDAQKRELEAKFTKPIKSILNQIASDAKIAYLTTGDVQAENIAKYYKPEFLSITRQIQRESIKKFGFTLREKYKELDFKPEKQKALIDYQIQYKDADPILITDSQIDKVDKEFSLASILFVAEQSEIQTGYITNTTEKEVSEAQKLAVILFFDTQKEYYEKLDGLNEQLRALEFNEAIQGSLSINQIKKNKLKAKIEALTKEIEAFNQKKDLFIADNIKEKLTTRASSRSPLISEQNVGLAQSWAKAAEEDSIANNISGIAMEQNWRAILDSHTRHDHAVADGQKKVNGFYIVGGHRCTRPYDPSLPIEQTAYCRCQEETKIVFLVTEVDNQI